MYTHTSEKRFNDSYYAICVSSCVTGRNDTIHEYLCGVLTPPPIATTSNVLVPNPFAVTTNDSALPAGYCPTVLQSPPPSCSSTHMGSPTYRASLSPSSASPRTAKLSQMFLFEREHVLAELGAAVRSMPRWTPENADAAIATHDMLSNFVRSLQPTADGRGCHTAVAGVTSDHHFHPRSAFERREFHPYPCGYSDRSSVEVAASGPSACYTPPPTAENRTVAGSSSVHYICVGCGQYAEFLCSKCKRAWYCSRQCQASIEDILR